MHCDLLCSSFIFSPCDLIWGTDHNVSTRVSVKPCAFARSSLDRKPASSNNIGWDRSDFEIRKHSSNFGLDSWTDDKARDFPCSSIDECVCGRAISTVFQAGPTRQQHSQQDSIIGYRGVVDDGHRRSSNKARQIPVYNLPQLRLFGNHSVFKYHIVLGCSRICNFSFRGIYRKREISSLRIPTQRQPSAREWNNRRSRQSPQRFKCQELSRTVHRLFGDSKISQAWHISTSSLQCP